MATALFVCLHNAGRSQMSAALLERASGGRHRGLSAGSEADPNGHVHPPVVEVMRELGIDIARHRSKTFDTLADTSFDLVVTLSPEAHHRALEMTRVMACDVEYWPIFDPTIIEGSRDARLAAYRDVRDTLIRRIQARFPGVPAPESD